MHNLPAGAMFDLLPATGAGRRDESIFALFAHRGQ